jgi:protein-ribulosamine 3-kinase
MSAAASPAAGPFLEAALRRALDDPGLRLLGLQPVGGGCIHHAARVATTRGDWFAKWNDDCAADLFHAEAEGLRALAEAASDGPGVVVPRVLAASGPGEGHPAFILMEHLPPGGGRGDDAALGRGLAAIHRVRGEGFGFPVTTYCGSTPQDNRPAASGVEFYASRRLEPLARLLEAAGRIGPAERRTLDGLVDRLPSLLPHEPPPSLVHGDLWSGNVLRTARGPALVDPACAGADREMEFGITTLFGGFSDRFLAAYEEAWPLPPGWRERNPVYQLYHLLNHHLIFGGHYGSQAMALARRYA